MTIRVFGQRAPVSVHLCDYPACDEQAVDQDLSEQMELLRELLPVFDNLERASSHAETASDVNSLTDGIAMGHEGMRSSLVSREVIADSVELTMRGHCYDALVGLAGCDKSLPGMMMAMVRLNVPSMGV